MSWLTDYLAYTAKQESPEPFHMWSGITAIAAALGRKVWLDRRSGGVTRYRIYPGQIMTVLVAGSGRARKSTAIDQVVPFLEKIGKPMIGGKSSPEAFLKQMDPNQTPAGHPQAILVEGELTVLLTKGGYAEPLIDVLIKLADAGSQFQYNTLTHGHIVIPEPCLTMLAATTPESLGDRLPTGAHGSGFMSRVIFVYCKTTDRVEDLSDVEDTDINDDDRREVIRLTRILETEMQRFTTVSGPFTFTPKGREWFRAFYKRWVESPAGQGEGWPSRRPDHTLRVAMVIAVSKGRMELDENSLAAADKLLYFVEQDFDKAMAFIGTSYTKDRQRILDFITLKAGKATTTEIVAALYPYFPDIEILLRTLRLLTAAGVLRHSQTSHNPPVDIWELAGFTITI